MLLEVKNPSLLSYKIYSFSIQIFLSQFLLSAYFRRKLQYELLLQNILLFTILYK